MKRHHISTYFNMGITGVLAIAFILVCAGAVWMTRNSTISSVVSRLDVCLQMAYDRINLTDEAGIARVEEIIEHENAGALFTSRDERALSELLDRCRFSKDFSYEVAVAADGSVLASNAHFSGSMWPFGDLIEFSRSERATFTTTEIIRTDVLEGSRNSFRAKAQIETGEEGGDVLRDAYVHMAVSPVFDDGDFVGALIEGVLLNNNHELPVEYSAAAPGTYLSIGTTSGIRICSNIASEGFSYLTGTSQRSEYVDEINTGNIWRGPVPMVNGGTGVVVAGPLVNHDGVVVGNIGVGSPVSSISALSLSHYALFALGSMSLFVCSVLLGRRLTSMITRPVSRLQEISKAIARGGTPPDDLMASMPNAPVEIVSLVSDMHEMANRLTEKNQELEEKVLARTAQLAQTIDELRSANLYKSQFLANISHELRTPLNSIIGFASLLEDGVAGPLNASQRKYAQTIIESGNHLLELINDILGLVKLDTSVDKPRFTSVDVCRSIRRAVDLIQPQLGARKQTIAVEIDGSLEGRHATWDEQKIHQVLLNLLSNSVKFSPEGGHIAVTMSPFDSNSVLIHVIDNGIGVSDELKERVFLAFERADNSYTRVYKGAGLGLAITKGIVEMHGGRIWLEDAVGGGLKACLTLPLRPEMSA